MTLDEIKNYYKSVFYMEDDFVIEVVLACAIGMYTSGDPIWIMLNGGSSSGKSELIQMLSTAKKVYSISNMTENTFLSGMRSQDGKETSLLRRIGKRGMILMKDYTSVLAMRSEKREIISSQMREIYDGEMTKPTGNGVNPEWKGKVNFIGGVTDSIFSSEGESAGMGRRSIMYCLPQQDRRKTLNRSRQNTNDADIKREKIKEMAKQYVDGMDGVIPFVLPPVEESFSQELMVLADFSTHARSPVDRDYRGIMTLVHDAEMPMRVSQQLHLIAQIITYMHGGVLPEHAKAGIIKIAFDNIPKLRKISLTTLAKYRRITTKGMAQETDYPTETAKIWLEDLTSLKITKRSLHGASKMDVYEMKKEYKEIVLKYHPWVEVVDDDLLGTEEHMEGLYVSDGNDSIDAVLVQAAARKSQMDFDDM